MVCIFSPVTTRTTDLTPRADDPLITPQPTLSLTDHLHFKFSLILIKNGQVGYEKFPYQIQLENNSTLEVQSINEQPSLQLEVALFNLYFTYFHPAFPILLKQSILHIHSQDRLLLSRSLRFAIMTIACHFYYNSPIPELKDLACSMHHFYQIAKLEIKSALNTASNGKTKIPPRLDTVQSLILLYKHHEITGTDGIHYLETAQELVGQLHPIVHQQQEMINRTRWILFSLISLSNLSDKQFNRMYSHIDLPSELPQPLTEEIEEDQENSIHINRFAQISNLSVLYSHTVQSLIINSTSQLICFQQFKEIRQHWHDSLHPVTQSRLVALTDPDGIDILILYTAILYDMLYLLLILHHQVTDLEWDTVDTAYRLQRMVHTWVSKPSFISAIQSRRMASFALMLCLQIQLAREEDQIDIDFIDQIRQTISCINIDPRLDNELKELHILVTNKTSSGYLSLQQQPVDYFSLVPPQMHSTVSSQDHISASTPGLWDILSATTNGGLTTPIREDDHQTSAWVTEQQRQQEQQLYQFMANIPSTAIDSWNTIEQLNQMKI